nr:hypothetical protein [Tanacetum cinerariifolium]
ANDKTGLGYDSQINKSDLNYVHVNESHVIGNSLIDSHESDGEDNQVNDRFKKSEGYHVVPPPYTGNYMPPRADLSFAGLVDYVFKSKVCETITSVPKTETNASKTSKDSLEKLKFVRSSAHIIEEWESNSEDENVVEKTEVNKTVKPSLEKIEFVNARNTTTKNKSKAEKPRKLRQSPKVLKNKGKNTRPKENRPVWDNAARVNYENKLTHPHPKRKFVPAAVITKSRLVPVNVAKQSSHRAATSASTARHVNTVAPKPYSPVRRSFNKKSAAKTNNFYEKVNTAKTQTFKRTKRGKDTKIPQSSSPPKKVGDEAVYTGEDDRVVRAATTAASLKADGEDSMEHQDDLMDFVPPSPHDSPLSGGHTPGSNKGRPNINELMVIYTQLSNRVLTLEQSKTAQYLVIKKIQKKVKRIKRKIKNGDQPLPRVTQVSIAGTSSNEQPPLKEKSMCNKTAKDLWDALARHMLGSEYGEQDRKAVVLYEYETFKATEGELFLDLHSIHTKWKQYATMMRQNKNLMDININALYNILKQNQGDVNDAMGLKKKNVVVTSDPLALIAEKTKKITALLAKAFNRRKFFSKPTNNNLRTSSTSQSVNKKQEFVKSGDKKEDKKADEKKRDISKVKCYNCKKEGHFAKDCKKVKVKDYEYYKTKMLLTKKDKDEQVFLAEDQAWMESSSDSDQEINAYMVFMA